MSAAHTPGPWRVFLTRDGRHVIGVGDKNAGGITDQGDVATNDQGVWRSGPEKIANAHLIAAAPELLDALSKAVKWLAISDDPRCEKDLNAAEAALAKALPLTSREMDRG